MTTATAPDRRQDHVTREMINGGYFWITVSGPTSADITGWHVEDAGGDECPGTFWDAKEETCQGFASRREAATWARDRAENEAGIG